VFSGGSAAACSRTRRPELRFSAHSERDSTLWPAPSGHRGQHGEEEDLPGGRVRILTQETQIGRPAAGPARQTQNPMLNGHQAWLDGLVRAASGKVRA
jgi:hypothetical protein